jgi:hypothetical protein
VMLEHTLQPSDANAKSATAMRTTAFFFTLLPPSSRLVDK